MINIKEVIVVEGRDDETAVKKAANCEIIITHGFGIKERTFKRIEEAQKDVASLSLRIQIMLESKFVTESPNV